MDQGDTSDVAKLQNMLKDEKERCIKHKENYQTLKDKYGKLEAELKSVCDQLREAADKHDKQKAFDQSYIEKLENRIREKENEICNLTEKVNSLDPKKLRESILEEATNHYELKIKELNSEIDNFREQYNNLHYEHAIMRCQLKSRESEFKRNTERIKLQHMNEVDQLQNKIEKLENEKSCPADTFAVELKSAKREILQLEAKVKVVIAECEELRARNENLSLEINSINRTHAKQLADYMTTIRSLESERSKLIMQKDVLQKEFNNCQEHRKLLNKELQECKREAYLLQGKLTESEHKCLLNITNLQVEMERWKAEQESEKEYMAEEMSKIKMELSATIDELNKAQQVLLLKEQEYQQNLMIANQQLWKQTNELNKEKDKLERKLLEIENDKAEHITRFSQEFQVLKQNLQLSNEAKLSLEKEVYALKNKLDEMSNSSDHEAYTALAKEHSNCRKEIQDLREKITSLNTSQNEIISKKNIELQSGQDHEILQLRLSWEQQKHQFHQKLDELESQLKATRHTAASEKQELEQKIKKYCHYINKLKERVETLKSQNDDLETQTEELKKNVPEDVYLEVKNELEIVKKRIEEYRRIVSSGPGFPPSRISAPQPVEKLLADIKNLQFPINETRADQGVSARHAQKISATKRRTHSSRRSSKTQHKDFPSLRASSPVISSSSDIDLENL